jgi:hypothetical protein
MQRLKKKICSASESVLSSQRKYLAACGNRTCRFTASIMRVFTPVMLGTISGGEDAGPNISPSAVVERLFLCPYISVTWMAKICPRSYLTPKDICIGVCIEVRSNLGNDQKVSQSWKEDNLPNHKGREKTAPRD